MSDSEAMPQRSFRGGEPALLQRFWSIDLLTPALRGIRGLINTAMVIAVLFLAYTGVALSQRSGAAALAVVIGGAIGLGILYVIIMFFPDLASLLKSIETRTRRGDAPEGYRHVGIVTAALLWRYIGAACIVAAILLPAGLIVKTVLRESPAFETTLIRAESRFQGMMTIVSNVSMLLIVVGAVFLLVQDFQRKRRPRLVTLSFSLLAFSVIAMFLSSGETGIHLSRSGEAAIWIGWLAAGVIALQRLRRETEADELLKGFLIGVVVVAALLLLAGWYNVFMAPLYLRYLLLSVSRQSSSIDAIWKALPPIDGSREIVVSLLLMLPTLLAGIISWLKSDAARALVDIERNLRPAEVRPQYSPYVMYARLITWPTVFILGLLLAFSLERSGTVLEPLRKAMGRSFDTTFGSFGPIEFLWSGLTLIIGLVAALDLVRITFDLADYTSRPDAPATARFWTLRVLITIQYLVSAALGGIIVMIFWSGTRSAMVRLGGVLLGAIAFLTFSFIAAVVSNLLRIEANIRVGDGITSSNASYPSLSFIATVGKAIAWLLSLGVLLAVIGVASIGGDEGAIVGFLVAVPAAGVLFVILSSIPDFVRLLLTIESHIADGGHERRPDAAASEVAQPALAPATS